MFSSFTLEKTGIIVSFGPGYQICKFSLNSEEFHKDTRTVLARHPNHIYQLLGDSRFFSYFIRVQIIDLGTYSQSIPVNIRFIYSQN